MNLFMSLLATILASALISVPLQAAANPIRIIFDVHVTSCSGSEACTIPDTGFRFQQVWTLPGYNPGVAQLFDFGGGTSMLKVDTYGMATVSSSPFFSEVLNAARMSSSDITPYYYFENARYFSNGIGDERNYGDLQLRNQGVLKTYNTDGSINYSQHNSDLWVDISGTQFSDIQPLTVDQLRQYFMFAPVTAWYESGSFEIYPDETSPGTTVSNLIYSGTATFVSVSEASEPSPLSLVMLGATLALGLGWRTRSDLHC